MKRTYEYRLYPNRVQRETLDSILDFCRFLYNNALEERIAYYKKYSKSLNYPAQEKSRNEIVEHFSEAKLLHSQTFQAVLKQLDSAYKNFFRRVKSGGKPGFPRFKGKDRFRSFRFPQCDLTMGGVKLLPDNKHVQIKTIKHVGDIRIEYHRPFQGRCKQVAIVKKHDKYYLQAVCTDMPKAPLPKTNSIIGIDLGLSSFFTDQNGNQQKHPKPYKTAKEKLAYLQRKLAAKQKASKFSNAVKKLKQKISKVYERISNIRKDFQFKTARKLVEKHDVICVEKLDVNNMLTSSNTHSTRNTDINEAAWSSFVEKLSYVAESANKTVIFVPAANTSRRCSKCGRIKGALSLRKRTYICFNPLCGLRMDRDQNAACNVLEAGTALSIAQAFSTLATVEEAHGLVP